MGQTGFNNNKRWDQYMEKRTTLRKRDLGADHPERRAFTPARGMSRVLHLLRNLWVRPLGLQRRGRGLKLVLLDRRRPLASDEPPKLAQIRAELRERLLGHQLAHATQVMRHLALVHDELGRAGWPGVEALPAQVLGMATVQAEMLASEKPSVVMSHVAERLRLSKVAADVNGERLLREERAARARDAVPEVAAETADPAPSGFDEGAWAGRVPVPTVIPDQNA